MESGEAICCFGEAIAFYDYSVSSGPFFFRFEIVIRPGPGPGPELDNLYSKLDPSKSELLKLSDCSMVLEEQPEKIMKAVKLFLQGLGFHLNHGRSRSEDPRNRMSLQLKGE